MRKGRFLFALLCIVSLPVSATHAASISTTFDQDPATMPGVVMSGPWVWTLTATTDWLASSTTARCLLYWNDPLFSSGILTTRVKLMAAVLPAVPSVTLIFSRVSSSQYRYVTLVTGAPGKVILGQKGIINGVPAWKKTASVDVPLKHWLDVRIEIGLDAGIDVYLTGLNVVSDTTRTPVEGAVGILTPLKRVLVDSFAFDGGPDVDPNLADCHGCHSGSPPVGSETAPNVYTYWDGSWWDTLYAGLARVNQGGHGDPDNKPVLTCVGTTGCHNLWQSLNTHQDGVLGERANASVNTYHLREGFIDPSPSNPWDVQVTFDNFCATACHPGVSVTNMTMALDDVPAPGVVKFGSGCTIQDGSAFPWPTDADLSSRAASPPKYAPCVACHDPHGTGIPYSQLGSPISFSNRMLRESPQTPDDASPLCLVCHR